MAVTANKMARDGGATYKKFTQQLTVVINQTKLLARVVQVPYSFLVTGVSLFASAVTDTVHAIVGVLPPGKTVQGVTLVIGSTTTKFKINAAFMGVMPQRVLNEFLQRVLNVGVTDNIAFSSAFTINAAALAQVTWGAVRVQMDYLGNVTTLVSAQDQAYNTEAEALYACPAASETMLDLGTITISMASGATFTAQTTALTGGSIAAVNYNGAPSGVLDVCSADPQFVAGAFVRGARQTNDYSRGIGTPGGLLLIQYTTDGSGALTNGIVDVDYSPWPLNGEAVTSA